MEFKIGDQVLLHRTKAEKQWSRKFNPKWDSSFHIHEALGNGAYKLRLKNRILKKVVHGNWLKIYHVKQELSLSVSQLGTQISLIRPEDILQDLEPIIYKDKNRRGEDESSIRTKCFLSYPPPERQCGRKNCLRVGGGKEGDKEREKGYKRRYLVPELKEIKEALAHGTELPETGEWTPDNAQEWKKSLPPAYWFYKIGEQLDLKTLYEDLSQKTFNKEAIQQVEKFVGKNNLTLHYKAVYRLYATFQHCPNVLLNGSIKTIIVNSIG
ncbi:hypothetical protein G9A89_006132 [Geosiphon pyriformis]|nr:hypothetical protein G9A89_006132 [Geosiphon pyriformis]